MQILQITTAQWVSATPERLPFLGGGIGSQQPPLAGGVAGVKAFFPKQSAANPSDRFLRPAGSATVLPVSNFLSGPCFDSDSTSGLFALIESKRVACSWRCQVAMCGSSETGAGLMKFIGRAEEVAGKIVAAFQAGNLPKALAPIFIRRKDGVPCRSWSFGNQLLCILYGTSDARGFRQWNECGRWVKKGSKAFDILVPLMKSATVIDEDTNQPKRVEVLIGFKAAPVFAVECTDGKELPKADDEVLQWINALPLVEVARAWGLNVDAFDCR